MELYFLLLSFVLGVSIGSFFGVVVDRIPKGESIIRPPSHCTNCSHELKWYENIPILSYLFLRGRCSSCNFKIPVKWLFLELIFGVFGIIVYFAFFTNFQFSYN